MQDIEEIVESRIGVEWLILADAAEINGGKLYLLGGGWDRFTVSSPLPVEKQIAIALAFRIPWYETNKRHTFQLKMENEDGTDIAAGDGQFEVGRSAMTPAGQSLVTQLVINVGARFEKLGAYVIRVQVNNDSEHVTTFNVLPGPGY